jgi:hypothetical protein
MQLGNRIRESLVDAFVYTLRNLPQHFPSQTAFSSAFFYKSAIFIAYIATRVNFKTCTQSNAGARKISQFFSLQRKNQKAENKPKTAKKPHFDPFSFAIQAKSWK